MITHGHEDHIGALPWVIRDLGQDKIPVVYGGQLTIAMARSKLDEHKLREVNLEVLPIGDTVEAGPFEIERVHLTHSIPDASGIALKTPLGTVLFTGDYKFDQTPVGGAPADMARLAELGRDGVLLLCGDSTNVDRPGISESASRSSARTSTACSPAARAASSSPASRRTSTASSRSSTPPRRANRKVALVGRSMRKNVNIGRSLGHIDVPEGMLVPPREIDQWADEKIVIISTGSQGEPLSRAAPDGLPRPPAGRAQARGHGGLLRHADPGQRARGQRDDRPPVPHRLRRRHRPRRADPRLRPRLRGGGQDDDQPHAAEVRDAGPRRLQAHAHPLRAGRGGRRPAREHLPQRERNAAGDRRRRRALRDQGARPG